MCDDYTEESIKQRILKNNSPKRQEMIPEPKPKQKRYRFQGNVKQNTTKKVKGLQALYLHYLYKMGILPKQRASSKRVHFLLREDLRHLDELAAQARLLCKNRIENGEQLTMYQNGTEQKMRVLKDTRKSLYRQLRRFKDDVQLKQYKTQIAGLSKQLTQMRKEVKLCTGIMSRSAEMQQKLHQVRQEQIHQGKERKEYDQRSRSSRPNRQHES